MAKIVNPPAVLEPRPDDVDLPLHLLSRLSPFSQLKTAPSLDKYPGACRLRFFHAGEEVCVHGEPGWSAFCFVPVAEIASLRDHARKCLQDGPANLEKLIAAATKTEADRQAIVQQFAQKDLPEKDKKELEKKLGSLEREQEKQQAAHALLDEELTRLPEVRRRFDEWLENHKQETEQADPKRATAELPGLIDQARQHADVARLAILDELAAASPARQRQLADLLEPTERSLARLVHVVASGADSVQRVAHARLPRLRPQEAPSHGLLDRLRNLFGGQRSSVTHSPAFIPGDGPRDLDYASRLCSLYFGELIGEISCLNRTPRSATVTMVRDGFVVELMRHILDLMSKDAAYQERVEASQRQRLINSALRETPLFADLPEAELARISRDMEFQSYEPGSLICDQHEEAECMYVIGNGIIKVVTGVSWLLPPDSAIDVAALKKELPAVLAETVSDGFVVRQLNKIISDPAWRLTPAVHAVADSGLVATVWRMIATTELGNLRGQMRCNRLVLTGLDAKTFPALKPDADGAFSVADFGADWKKLCTQLVADDKKPDEPGRTVWDRLSAPVQELARTGRTAELAPLERETIVAGVNSVLRDELLLLTPAGSAVAQSNANLAGQILPMLAEGQLWCDYDFHRWNRCLNRLILQALCPKTLGQLPRPSGLPTIHGYCSRNQILGEIGLVQQQPRSATLVTYNHPKNDPKREVGPVHLFRIGKTVVDEMLQRRPELRERLVALAAERRQADRQRAAGGRRRTSGVGPDPQLLHSPRGEQLGLVEGQKLMLIDLDRCTRCDECVRACVNTHDDGHSRLFLIGPRQGQYLVPATCRSCLDPVCMIGCPVNSIQRGDNKEILIRDWCIGCERCAQQCPYGSIQMHDTGLVPEATHGWRYAFVPPPPSGESVEGKGLQVWTQRDYDDCHWSNGATPFVDDSSLDAGLSQQPGEAPRGALAFRRIFRMAPTDYLREGRFQLELVAPGDQARVWLNGIELHTAEKPRQGRRKFAFGPAKEFVKPGDNLLAVWVPRPAEPTGQTLFTLRLDAERDADSAAVEIKLVTSRAVVCDLCSTLPTGPACVHACPHDAAMRVNAVRA